MIRRSGSVLLAMGLIVAACAAGSSPSASVPASSAPSASVIASPSADPSAAVASTTPDFVVGGDRPVTVHVPSSYDPATPAPLLIRLHGFADSGYGSESYLQLGEVAEARGMLYAYPDGSTNSDGYRFWQATDACCDFDRSGVDDSAYLAGVITEVQAKADVDPKRIFVFGHSNGGFMSYRMACDHADTIAAIVSLAAATYADPADCRPSSPVAVLEIHGTSDASIRYEGGNVSSVVTGASLADYPGALETVETWAAYDGCSAEPTTSPGRLDLDAAIAGPDGPAETTVEVYDDGCAAGGHVELWTMDGGSHVPDPAPGFADAVVDFMLAHPKP